MPTYEYQCLACGKVRDIKHGFKETVTDPCDCGGELKRRFTAAPIVFKGSGFYVTDSRGGGKSESSSSDSSSKPSTSSSSDTTAAA